MAAKFLRVPAFVFEALGNSPLAIWLYWQCCRFISNRHDLESTVVVPCHLTSDLDSALSLLRQNGIAEAVPREDGYLILWFSEQRAILKGLPNREPEYKFRLYYTSSNLFLGRDFIINYFLNLEDTNRNPLEYTNRNLIEKPFKSILKESDAQENSTTDAEVTRLAQFMLESVNAVEKYAKARRPATLQRLLPLAEALLSQAPSYAEARLAVEGWRDFHSQDVKAKYGKSDPVASLRNSFGYHFRRWSRGKPMSADAMLENLMRNRLP